MTPEQDTATIMQRFNEVFLRHDPAPLTELVAKDCRIENTQPAPDGSRHEGREACVALWTSIATAPGTYFALEDTIALGDRAMIFWRYTWGPSADDSVRGVNLMKVREGQIVEALGYVKGK